MRLRGRKGIKEAIESQKELIILTPSDYKGRWKEFFGNSKPIHVELGMGKGKFISEMSVLHPEVNYIGVDMYDELVRRASEKARLAAGREDGAAPANLALARMNIERIEEAFAAGEIDRIYLNFSDPWPKKKHARRRLTHAGFLHKYKELLNESGEIHFKTDSRSLFEFSLNTFADLGLRMRNISLDLHAEGPAANNVMTEYESKFSGRGFPIHRVEVVLGEAALSQHLQQLAADKEAPEEE
ncbi:MAG: tRNA (guanine-N7)-methyltransferase [Paenibacillus sp.]|jgi:tRNA (guanine-N7-)-methyltransferase|nr:tRNA (guanine-N7)-methyltransferase [Paenibacillus sp.]